MKVAMTSWSIDVYIWSHNQYWGNVEWLAEAVTNNHAPHCCVNFMSIRPLLVCCITLCQWCHPPFLEPITQFCAIVWASGSGFWIPNNDTLMFHSLLKILYISVATVKSRDFNWQLFEEVCSHDIGICVDCYKTVWYKR